MTLNSLLGHAWIMPEALCPALVLPLFNVAPICTNPLAPVIINRIPLELSGISVFPTTHTWREASFVMTVTPCVLSLFSGSFSISLAVRNETALDFL